MSEGRKEQEIDRWIGAASAVLQMFYRSVVVRRELSWMTKLSIYQSFYVPTLTCGHKLWAVTDRMRSRIQEPNHPGWAGVKSLLIYIESSQMRW